MEFNVFRIITDFISTIVEIIVFAFDFFVDTVEGLAYCVELLAYFTLNIPDYFSWFPTECLAPLVLVFGIAVTYKILGREG